MYDILLNIVFPFAGGLGLFIYGMQVMAQSLQKAAGGKLKKLLEVVAANRFYGIFLGTFITAVIQSSSATTVMVVGFVNAGIMNLSQAASLIFGANIGTTITSWLVSSVEWSKFLSPTTLAPVILLIGVVLSIASKKGMRKEIGHIMVGLGILFIGIKTMSSGAEPLRDSEAFKAIFVHFGTVPVLGILAGAGITAVIQASAASVGILQTLAIAGLVPFNAAVYIIMGQNIGTCATALLSSIGANKIAKSAAYIHLLFNVVGTIFFCIIAVFYFKNINPSLGASSISSTQISVVHTAFNLANAVLLFPFINYLISLAKKMANYDEKENLAEGVLIHLDDRVLETPSFAVESAVKEVVRLGHIVQENLEIAGNILFEENDNLLNEIEERENAIDSLSSGISNYLVKICNTDISPKENNFVTSLFHVVSDFERVGDHCENLSEISEFIRGEKVKFSSYAEVEMKELIKASKESFESGLKALEFYNAQFAYETMEKEEIVDKMEKEFRKRHIYRLTNHECNDVSGPIFLDIIINLERISDHAQNIAEAVLEQKGLSLDKK